MNHKFVKFIPRLRELEANTLYISIEYCVASHKCCCGCDNEVVTPLSPTDWKLTFDGKTITLNPSIGNWNFKCQSHYWIRNGNVIMASKLSKTEIEHGRQHDKRLKREYYDNQKNQFAKLSGESQSKSNWFTKLIRVLKAKN